MKRTLPNLSVCLALLSLLAACADEKDTSIAECNLETCSDKCLDLAGPDCDVLRASCQQRIFEAVSCVRGGGGKLAEIRVLTEEELRAESADAGLEGGVDSAVAEVGADGGLAAEPEPVDRTIHWDTALRLLGLRIPESSTDKLDYVGGYYDREDGRVTLVDRGLPQHSASSQMLLAHELVHSLQDQRMGLTELSRNTGRSTDAMLALGCLTEGEADLYEQLAWTLLQGLSLDQPSWDATLARNLKFNRDSVLADDSPYDQLWLLRYPVGTRFLVDAWLDGGDWSVQSLYEAPPVSSAFWMHGYAASRERTQPLTQILACNVAAKPKGFERSWSDTLGAFGLFAFLGHNLTDKGVYKAEESWRRALSWRQDHLEVFFGPGDETALSWRIRFADEDIAHEVAKELSASTALALRVKAHGEEIEILASDSTAVLKAWRGTDPKHCPLEE